jgi:hypothetical protein
MDAQTISLGDLTGQAQALLYLKILLALFCTVLIVWLCVSGWRREQQARARRRVLDRLAQEEDPEGWVLRQARQAQVAALVAAELAEVRRWRWYARLLGWGWR